MKKNDKYRINILISTIIILGYFLITVINYSNYSKIIKDDIKNISKLTSTNIYSEINNELIKPIFVSLTMANDSFLKSWLSQEEAIADDANHIKSLKEYLIGIKEKYDYNSVFLVSSRSNNYYHYKGVQKKLSLDQAHDAWYYNFISSKQDYSLDVDNDEVDNNSLTVFVNCRIENTLGELMGVAGVGLNISLIQTTLSEFEDNYNLEAFLIDKNGLVQVHTDNKLIETLNVFNDSSVSPFKDEIISNKNTLETYRYKEEGVDGYLIVRYIDELDWYLVIKKDTAVLKKSFTVQLIEEFAILLVVIFCGVFLINKVIEHFKQQIEKMAITDQLTGLLNRRGFDSEINKLFNENLDSEMGVNIFVFDIDDFKRVNDTYGHILGDRVIKLIGECAKAHLNKSDIIARWGGDEFAGIIYGNMEEAESLAKRIVTQISQEGELKKLGVTISIGQTQIQKIDTPETLLNRADRGLYISKSKGKNQLNVL